MKADTTLVISDPGPVLGAAPESVTELLPVRLSRSNVTKLPPGGTTRTLFRLFGLESAGELPAGAVTRDLDVGDAGDGCWMRADPVWMQVGSRLVLGAGSGQLALTAEETRELESDLQPLFRGAGLDFSAPGPLRWYVRLGGEERLETTPPDELAGRDCSDHLPERSSPDAWRRLMGEAQMLLHNHPVNRARRSAGRPPANSLWFWGSGRLPRYAPGGFTRVLGSDAVARALAALPVKESVVHSAGALLVANGTGDDESVWDYWLEASGATDRVLVPSAGREFHARPWHRLRFWRRARSLEALMSPAGGRVS